MLLFFFHMSTWMLDQPDAKLKLWANIARKVARDFDSLEHVAGRRSNRPRLLAGCNTRRTLRARERRATCEAYAAFVGPPAEPTLG